MSPVSLSLSFHLCFILLCFLLWLSLSPSSSPSALQALRPLTFVSIPFFLPLLTVNTCTFFEGKNNEQCCSKSGDSSERIPFSCTNTKKVGAVGGSACVWVCVCVCQGLGKHDFDLHSPSVIISHSNVAQKYVLIFLIHHKFLKQQQQQKISLLYISPFLSMIL